MKTLQFKGRALNLALAAILAVAGSAFVVDSYAGTATADLDVSATISANCTISTTALAFGAYDPIVAHATAALEATGTVTTTCTNGSAATVTLGQGANADVGSTDAAPQRRMSDGGTNYLSYDLFSDAGRTAIFGNTDETGKDETGTGGEVNTTVYGRVTAGQNMPAGNYTDTVVATVTF
jgi:spore coat protein U-like protein